MSTMRVGVFGAITGVLALAAVLLFPHGGEHTAAAREAGSRVRHGQGEWFLHGVNVAWYNWACDFGCGEAGGVRSQEVQEALRPRFAELAEGHIRTLRWWMFEGDAWQIERDRRGAPVRINPAVYEDIDAALALAEEYDLYYNFVLFSFPGDIPTAWLNDAAQRQMLAGALAPLFARYADNPHVLAWEVFNEPEWDIWQGKVRQQSVQETVRAIVQAVKANSDTYTTVGSAMLDGLPMWKDVGLDFYQAHWYDYMSNGGWCAMCTDSASVQKRYGIDAPIVIGEYYTGSGSEALRRHEAFFDKGYAGAWGWSLFGERTYDRMQVDVPAAADFSQQHGDVVGPQRESAAAPAPDATASPTVVAPEPRQPDPAPTQAPVAAWRTSATVSNGKVTRGETLTVKTAGVSPASDRALFDVEIYSPSGQKVYQRYFDRQSFEAGAERNFNVAWKVPLNAERGTWTVRIGVFTPGWNELLHWNHGAATFTVR